MCQHDQSQNFFVLIKSDSGISSVFETCVGKSTISNFAASSWSPLHYNDSNHPNFCQAPVLAARLAGLVTSEVKWGAEREGAAGEMLLLYGNCKDPWTTTETFGPQVPMKNEDFKPSRYGLQPLKMRVVVSHGKALFRSIQYMLMSYLW